MTEATENMSIDSLPADVCESYDSLSALQRILETPVEMRDAVLEQLAIDASPLVRIVARIWLHDGDVLARNRAAEVLEDFGTAEDIYALTSAMRHDDDWIVRASAASSIGYIGGNVAKQNLIRAFSNEADPDVKRYIAAALGQFDDARLVYVLQVWLDGETDPAIRNGILASLYKLGDDGAIDELLALAAHEDYEIRCQSMQGLVSILRPNNSAKVLRHINAIQTTERHPAVLDIINQIQKLVEQD